MKNKVEHTFNVGDIVVLRADIGSKGFYCPHGAQENKLSFCDGKTPRRITFIEPHSTWGQRVYLEDVVSSGRIWSWNFDCLKHYNNILEETIYNVLCGE